VPGLLGPVAFVQDPNAGRLLSTARRVSAGRASFTHP
jgi:hypothetical protein